jgi:hypothetical protein
MTAAVLATYGTYHPHHQKLKQLGCTPCERDVFGKIAGLIHRLDRAFVHLKEFAEELGYCRETISRAITSLERKKLVRRTGKKVYGFFPVVEILPLATNGDFPVPIASLTKRSTLVDQQVNVHCPQDQLQKKKTNKIKKQQHEVVCSEKIVDPEKLKVIDVLRRYGVGKNAAKALITRFSLERVKYQVEHFEEVQKRGGDIVNPAAWLTKAIQKRYQKPKNLVQNLAQTNDDVKTEQRQTANRLSQQAEQELSFPSKNGHEV